jgi:hypothetical protein
VYLLDHPPAVTWDTDEPAPVTIDGRAHGDIDAGTPLDLGAIAHTTGVHRIEIADREITVELAARGPRAAIATIGYDLDTATVRPSAGPLTAGATWVITGAVCAPPDPPGPSGLTVRYRTPVDVIDADGRKRNLAPPPPAAWLAHVGLKPDGPWEIPGADRVVWVCVDGARKQVIAQQPVDVPITDDALDIADWYAGAHVVDRTGGGAAERWQRLQDALADEP